MRDRIRRTGLVLCLLSTLALVPVLVGSASAQPRSSSGSAKYADPAGDSGTAPDVTEVTVNGDPTSGSLQIVIKATGMPSIYDGTDRDIYLWIDTDNNPATGSPSGNELSMVKWVDAEGRWWSWARWDGSQWQEGDYGPPTMGSSTVGEIHTFRLNRSDLGGAAAFGFSVTTTVWAADETVAGEDVAPDTANWKYDFNGTPPAQTVKVNVTPTIAAPTTVPRTAVAGKRLTISFPVTSSVDSKPMLAGKLVCDPSIAGKVITHQESFTGGVAKLSFLVPATAKGKVLRVKVTIIASSSTGTPTPYTDPATGQIGTTTTSYVGQSVTRIVTLHVK